MSEAKRHGWLIIPLGVVLGLGLGYVLFAAITYVWPSHAPATPQSVSVVAPQVKVPPEEPEPFRSLRRKMKERGMEWHIYSWGEEYIGWATKIGETFGKTVEEGGKPGWSLSTAYPTPEAAAEALSKAIDGPPNIFPDHCRPEIGTDKVYKKGYCE